MLQQATALSNQVDTRHHSLLHWSQQNAKLRQSLLQVKQAKQDPGLGAGEECTADEECSSSHCLGHCCASTLDARNCASCKDDGFCGNCIDGFDWVEGQGCSPVNPFGSPEHLTKTTQDIDDFIEDQKASEDACHARILEAKRSLDGVAAKVLQLSEEVEGQESIIEANTLLLKEAVDKLAASEEQRVADLKVCDANFEAAMEIADGYRDEKIELEQIADPEVRSKVAQDIDYADVTNEHVEEVAKYFRESPSFLQQNCRRVVDFLNRNETAGTKYSALDCDAARDVLQDEFSKSYVEIVKLLKNQIQLANEQKDDCVRIAESENAERVAAANADIKEATRNVEVAKDSLELLEPLLLNGQSEAEKLEAHILNLQETCHVDENVTAHLTRVRDLIESLLKCPGRNDFKLMVPDLTGVGS
jgi:hypothetical protein